MNNNLSPNILIVDDRKENLELLQAQLFDLDVNLHMESSSLQAFNLAMRNEYALIILDIQMPMMDGYVLAEKIRAEGINKSTPIIFLTAYHMDKENELKGYKSGCVDFILKPFDSSILRTKISIFLELYRNRKIKEEQNVKLQQVIQNKELLEARLRKLASNYRTILEGQSELILKIDSTFHVDFANKAFSDFFDYTLDGISENSLCDISDELCEQIKDAVTEMNGKKEICIEAISINNYQKKQFWIEWNVFKEFELDEIHYLIIGRDVSDRKQWAQAFLHKEEDEKVTDLQNQLLQQKSDLETLGKMASSVVLEISQPLSGISMSLDNILLKMSKGNYDEQYIKQKCKLIFEDIDRIKNYISQIGNLKSAHKNEKSEEFDVNVVVKDAISLVETQFKNCPVQIRFEEQNGGVLLYGSRYKLQKVFIDILNNSIDALSEKSELNPDQDFCIDICSKCEGETVEIVFYDNGVGISEQNIDFIFEPFFTTKELKEKGGLGLYVAQDLINKMKGSIEIKSVQNQFTEVRLQLPLQEAEVFA